jgi:hypothetical protein
VVEVDHIPRFGRVLVSVNVAAEAVTRIRPRGFPGGQQEMAIGLVMDRKYLREE